MRITNFPQYKNDGDSNPVNVWSRYYKNNKKYNKRGRKNTGKPPYIGPPVDGIPPLYSGNPNDGQVTIMPISPDLGTTPVHKGDTPLYSGNPNALKMVEIAEKSKNIVNEDLRAQIDNKKDQREHDLAKEYLAKSNTNSGGNNQANEQAVALVNAQPKHDNKNKNDGPGKYKKRN